MRIFISFSCPFRIKAFILIACKIYHVTQMKNKCEAILITLINPIDIIEILLAMLKYNTVFDDIFKYVPNENRYFISDSVGYVFYPEDQNKLNSSTASFYNVIPFIIMLLPITLPLLYAIVNNHFTPFTKTVIGHTPLYLYVYSPRSYVTYFLLISFDK